MARLVGSVEILENEHATTLDRVTTNDGALITQGDVDGDIGLTVWDATGTEVDFATLDAGDVIFDTLQLDGYWGTEDTTGYNFRHTYDSATLPLQGGKTYRLEYKIDTTGFGPKYVRMDVSVQEIRSVDTSS